MRKIAGLILLLLGGLSLRAQDPQFSQFYAAQTYLNPAFAGSTAQARLALNYRNQWPQVPGAFVTYNMSFDYYMPEIHSGVGLIVTHDRAGTGALRFTNVGGIFAYEFKVTKDIVIKPGIQFSLYKRGVDVDQLLFADQIARGGGRASIEYVNPVFSTKFDFASGLLVYGKNFWVGFAADHLSRVNESLLESTAQLPPKYSIHGGGRIVLKKGKYGRINKAIWMAANLKEQNQFRQLDIGGYMEFFPVIFGAWYRGLPVGKSHESYHRNTDAITVLVGAKIDMLQVGYSYDLTLSRLIGNTGGAHEISIVYEFRDPRPKKHKIRPIPCPQF